MQKAEVITPETLQKAPEHGTGLYFTTEYFDQARQEWRLRSTQELRYTQHDLADYQYAAEERVTRQTAQTVINHWNDVHPTIWRYRLLSDEEVANGLGIQTGKAIRKRC